MTRSECLEILGNKDHPLYKEFHHEFYTNRWKCRNYYESLGLYKKGMVLHHKIVGCTNYEEWKIDEIEPMTKEEHSRLHIVVYKQGLGSQEAIDKGHQVLREKYATGECKPWNYGKTGVQVSPRKGKTGDDFPFLRASKKGMSGGWNRGITEDDPRYESLRHSEESKIKQSEILKEKTLKGENDAFLYSCSGRIWINNGERNKRIHPNEEIPEGYCIGKLTKRRKLV